MTETIVVTNELINAGQSRRGGWTKKQLAILGIDWPPRKGWKHRIIGRKRLTPEQVEEFLSRPATKQPVRQPGLFNGILAAEAHLDSIARGNY